MLDQAETLLAVGGSTPLIGKWYSLNMTLSSDGSGTLLVRPWGSSSVASPVQLRVMAPPSDGGDGEKFSCDVI